MTTPRRIDRRDFFRRSGFGSLAALGAPAIGAAGANARVGIGVIGCGARGTELIKGLTEGDDKATRGAEIVAVCDAYRPRLDAAAAAAKAKAVRRHRKLLRRADVDAVIVATPDHWHAQMAIEAMEAGKHVYLEPPLALAWRDAFRVAATARRTGRLLQVGAVQCAEDKWWRVRDAIAQNAIGPLLWSQLCFAANSRVSPWNRPIDADFRPKKLDWKAFLGPAPFRTLDAERFFRWQKFWEYSGGVAARHLYGKLAALLVAVGPALPVRVSAMGAGKVFADQEVPDSVHVIVQYPNDHTVVLIATQASSVGVGDVIRGHEGTVHFGGADARIAVQQLYQDKHPEQVHLRPRSRGSLMANFLECIRTGGTPDCGADVACPAAVAVDLANLALRSREVVHFDPHDKTVTSQHPLG